MSEVEKFVENLNRKVGESRQAQIRFAVCKSVDWSKKTMSAVGVSDDVPYEGVQLGYGYVDIKPKPDTTCLIGILEGKEALAFLVNAEEVELVEVKADKIQFNGGDLGFVFSDKLTDKINVLEQRCNDIVTALQGVTIALAPSGTFPLAPYFSMQPLAQTQKSQIEDTKITH